MNIQNYDNFAKALRDYGIKCFQNHKLANLTWFKVGGPADIFILPRSLSDIEKIIDLKNELQKTHGPIPFTVLGAGSNVLICDSGIRGIVVKLSFSNIKPIINHLGEKALRVDAGCLNYSLAQYCLKNGISGLEFLCSIPGTIGGGIFMNAGAYGVEYKDIVASIICLNIQTKEILEISGKELDFSYRYSNLQSQINLSAKDNKHNLKDNLWGNLIVLQADIKHNNKNLNKIDEIKLEMERIRLHRKNTQPITTKTCGSTFRNPIEMPAWQVVDKIGMRGYKHKSAMVSIMHSNFLINNYNDESKADGEGNILQDGISAALEDEANDEASNGPARAIFELGELIRHRAKAELNINLEWEIKLIGFKPD